MITEFALAFFCAGVLLFAGGYPLARLMPLSRPTALATAPLISLGVYSLCSLIYCASGIPTTAFTVFVLPLCAFSALALIVRARAHTYNHLNDALCWKTVCLYAGMGLAFGACIFLSALSSPSAIAQVIDNVHHLNGVRAFFDSQSFDSLNQTSYATAADRALSPMPGENFYPSTWHAVCALVCQITGCGAPCAVNAVNYAFVALVFPLGIALVMNKLFSHMPHAIVFGSFITVSFLQFPWDMLVYGPLYPNLAAFALLPCAFWVFTNIVETTYPTSTRIGFGLLFMCGLVALAFLQPNALFTGGILVACYCTALIAHKKTIHLGRWHIPAVIVALATVLLCVGLWALAYNAQPLQTVIHANIWGSNFVTYETAFKNILLVSYVDGFYLDAPHYVLALLVVIGCVYAFKKREQRWMVGAYILTCILLFVSMTMSGPETRPLARALCGFWYSDPLRMGAMAALCAIPLATLGAQGFYEGTRFAVLRSKRFFQSTKDTQSKKDAQNTKGTHSTKDTQNTKDTQSAKDAHNTKDAHSTKDTQSKKGTQSTKGTHSLVAIVFVCLLVALLVMPSTSNVNGIETRTPLECVKENIRHDYASYNVPYSKEKRDFIQQAQQVIGPDSVVINQPHDGSVFAYGDVGMRCYYRYFVGYGGEGETPESVLIREHLNEMCSNPSVREAVEDINAEYVLILDKTLSHADFLRSGYDAAQWTGLDAIEEDTPGFTRILENDGMSLFRIER